MKEIILGVVYVLLTILGLTGNSLVIFLVARSARLRNSTNILILNLAVADLLFVVFCVPLDGVYMVMGSWPFSVAACKIMNYFIIVSIFVSIYTLVIISFERLLLTKTLSGGKRFQYYRVLLPLLWIVAFAVSICGILNSVVFYVANQRVCYFGTRHYGWILIFVFGYLLPLLTSGVAYALLLKFVLQQRRLVEDGEQLDKIKSTTCTIAVVIIAFAICWLPYHIVMLDSTIGNATILMSVHATWIVPTATCLAYFNSCINPVLYGFLMPEIRREMWRILNKTKVVKDNEEQTIKTFYTDCDLENKNCPEK